MKRYNDFYSMFKDNVTTIPVCVFNWSYEKSPGVYVVKDDWAGFAEDNEICSMFESATSAMPGKERTFEVVVNDKYIDFVKPAIQEYCENYFQKVNYCKLGDGHYAFNCSRVIGNLQYVLQQEVDILNRIVHKYMENQLVEGQ